MNNNLIIIILLILIILIILFLINNNFKENFICINPEKIDTDKICDSSFITFNNKNFLNNNTTNGYFKVDYKSDNRFIKNDGKIYIKCRDNWDGTLNDFNKVHPDELNKNEYFNKNKDKRPFNVKNTSSPIGSRLLQRKMQFSTRAPLPSSSLSSSSSISDDDNYNNVIKNPYNDSKRGVNYEFNLNQTPPKSALSPLQRRLFMQGLNKKSNSGNDNSINNEEAPSSPMGDALLLRRRKVNPNNANNGNDNGLNFDVSSPKSSRLLQRKHQQVLEHYIP